MTDSTRRSVLAAVGATLTTAGCVTDPRGWTNEVETTTESGATDGTETTADGTTTGDWIAEASNEPDPDHSIYVTNDADETKTVRVRVVRGETDETVFQTTETVDSGVEYLLYNLKEADPEGVEPFDVCAELVASETTSGESRTTTTPKSSTTAATDRSTTAATDRSTTTASDRRSCATLQTSGCYGNAHVTVREDDSVQIIYAIC